MLRLRKAPSQQLARFARRNFWGEKMNFIKKWIFQAGQIDRLLVVNHQLGQDNKKRLSRVEILEDEGKNLRKLIGELKVQINALNRNCEGWMKAADERERAKVKLGYMVRDKDEEIKKLQAQLSGTGSQKQTVVKKSPLLGTRALPKARKSNTAAQRKPQTDKKGVKKEK